MSGPVRRYRLKDGTELVLASDYETVVRERDEARNTISWLNLQVRRHAGKILEQSIEINQLHALLDEAEHSEYCASRRICGECGGMRFSLPFPGHDHAPAPCNCFKSRIHKLSSLGRKILNDPDDEPTAGDGT